MSYVIAIYTLKPAR